MSLKAVSVEVLAILAHFEVYIIHRKYAVFILFFHRKQQAEKITG